MPTDQPIACSLKQTELSTRLGEMAALGDAALLEIRRAGTRAELVFAADPAVRQRLGVIVASEAQCCPFLAMRLAHAGGAITLEVEAPEGAAGAVSEIVDAFGGLS